MTAAIPQRQEKQPPSPPPPRSTAGVDMAQEDLTLPPALPPGVYFSPTKAEGVLIYLNRWIAGDAMPDADGWVVEEDVYGESPDALTRRYRPASTRNSEPSWWFLCHCKLMAKRGRGWACDRRVATGGYWKMEQTIKEVKCEVSGQRVGFKRNFGFYEAEDENPKTWWLMEEYTSVACPEDGVARGDGKKVLPALCRLYVTPRDPGKDKSKKRGRDQDGEDGAPMRAGPDRLLVPAANFDAIAALLPPSSVRGVDQEQTKDAQEAPPPSSVLGVGQEQIKDAQEALPPSIVLGVGQEQTKDAQESPPPQPRAFDLNQVYDASLEDHGVADGPSSVLGVDQEQTKDAQEAPPPSSVLVVGQEQTKVAQEAPPPSIVLGVGREQTKDAQEAPPPSSVLGVGQEQTKDAQEAPPPPPPQPRGFDLNQVYDASLEDYSEADGPR